MNHQASITFLGTRGSIPVCDSNFLQFGGNTSCIIVRIGGQVIVLDAGSGLHNLHRYLTEKDKNITVILSHPHFDHLLGIPLCYSLFDSTLNIDFYAKSCMGLSTKDQIKAIMSPPLWPTSPDIFLANINWLEMPSDCFHIGDVAITTLHCNHPGGSTASRLSFGDSSIVYATDCEEINPIDSSIIAFAKDCDLLIIDAQYTLDEIPLHRGFGHTSWQDAVSIGKAAHAKNVALFHHDPSRTDEQLIHLQRELEMISDNAFFAKEGSVVFI